MSRVLLALQYWNGDRDRAIRLARFLAAIEPVSERKRTLLLSSRFDCEGPTDEVVRELESSFVVHVRRGSIKASGHPQGCNALVRDTVSHLIEGFETGQIEQPDVAMLFEADCAPLYADWCARLEEAWDNLPNGAAVAGHYMPRIQKNKQPQHINGNLLLSCAKDVLTAFRDYPWHINYPWDLEIYDGLFTRLGAYDTGVIRTEYRCTNRPAGHLAAIRALGVVLHHGCRDESLMDQVIAELFPGWQPKELQKPAVGSVLQTGPPVWKYRDEFPSVLAQKFTGRRVQVGAPDDMRIFNPGLYRRDDGGLTMLFRAESKTRHSPSRVLTGQFDPKTCSAPELRPIQWLDEMAGPAGAGRASFEDPRITRTKSGAIWLSLSDVRYAAGMEPFAKQRLFEVTDKLELLREVPLGFDGNGNDGVNQKNWIFLEQAGELYAVHTLHPELVIYNVGTGAKMKRSTPAWTVWNRRYGVPRGGTPLVQVGQHWFGFFHSHVEVPTYGRRYFVGAYVLSKMGSEFTVTRISKTPLLTASAEDGFPTPATAGAWQPLAVFPCGAYFDQAQGQWLLSAGVNEHFSAAFKIPQDMLFRHF